MAIHDFSFQARRISAAGVQVEPVPIGPTHATMPHRPVEPRKTDLYEGSTNHLHKSEEIRQILPKGFFTMDRGMKEFFKGILVPTLDNTREMTVRIAGGDKSFLFWRQDLRSGRVKLPVMSVNRTAFNFHAPKYSPPILFASKRFLDSSRRRVAGTFRPWPVLMTYSCSVWAERKRDIEYVMGQVLTRFDPLAEIIISDEFLTVKMILKLTGANDNSDVDIGAEDLAKVRYDLSLEVEGYLPRAERVHSSILGRVFTLHEDTGAFLEEAHTELRNVPTAVFTADRSLTDRQDPYPEEPIVILD